MGGGAGCSSRGAPTAGGDARACTMSGRMGDSSTSGSATVSPGASASVTSGRAAISLRGGSGGRGEPRVRLLLLIRAWRRPAQAHRRGPRARACGAWAGGGRRTERCRADELGAGKRAFPSPPLLGRRWHLTVALHNPRRFPDGLGPGARLGRPCATPPSLAACRGRWGRPCGCGCELGVSGVRPLASGRPPATRCSAANALAAVAAMVEAPARGFREGDVAQSAHAKVRITCAHSSGPVHRRTLLCRENALGVRTRRAPAAAVTCRPSPAHCCA